MSESAGKSPKRGGKAWLWIAGIVVLLGAGAMLSEAYQRAALISRLASIGHRGEAEGCTPSDWGISNISLEREDEHYAKLTGTLNSNCTVSAAPQVKWTIYNDDGSVAFSDDFWPSGTVNIAPGSTYDFETMHDAPPGGLRYDLRVISVNRW